MLERLFLERPWLLAAGLVPPLLALIALWSWRRTRWTKRMVWCGLGAPPILIAISIAVETPREQMVSLLRQISRDLEAGEVDRIERNLSDDLQCDGMNRAELIARLAQRLQGTNISGSRLWGFDVRLISSDRAQVEFQAAAYVRHRDIPYEFFMTRWRTRFTRGSTGWVIDRIERLPIGVSGGSLIEWWK